MKWTILSKERGLFIIILLGCLLVINLVVSIAITCVYHKVYITSYVDRKIYRTKDEISAYVDRKIHRTKDEISALESSYQKTAISQKKIADELNNLESAVNEKSTLEDSHRNITEELNSLRSEIDRKKLEISTLDGSTTLVAMFKDTLREKIQKNTEKMTILRTSCVPVMQEINNLKRAIRKKEDEVQALEITDKHGTYIIKEQEHQSNKEALQQLIDKRQKKLSIYNQANEKYKKLCKEELEMLEIYHRLEWQK